MLAHGMTVDAGRIGRMRGTESVAGVARRHECGSECISSVTISGSDNLCVEVEGEAAAGMAESGLSGLHVHAGGDQTSGVRSAQIVEGEAFQAGSRHSWGPHSVIPVGVVDVPPPTDQRAQPDLARSSPQRAAGSPPVRSTRGVRADPHGEVVSTSDGGVPGLV